MDVVGYRKLSVWQEAHKFVLLIYSITKTYPKEEVFCLVSQIRRAAISVPANIVEGQARRTSREFLQFITISNGSLVEAEYYLKLSRDLGYISETKYIQLKNQQEQVGRLLHGLIHSLQNKIR